MTLLTVCVAQLAYWMTDEYRFTAAIRTQQRAAYEVSATWATDLLRAGVSWPQIAGVHPELERAPDGSVRVSAAALTKLEDDRFHRLNRYTWEGAFFLTVLVAAMAMVRAAIREQMALRQRHELFLAAASHELRSPLASLRLSADTLILRDPPPAKRAELVNRLLADLARLERTVSNILDTARLTGDRVALSRERISLTAAVGIVVDEMQVLAADDGVRLVADVSPALRIDADPDGVHCVIRNLVHNAIKASRGTAPGSTVTIAAALEEARVRLDVRDTGLGFVPSEAPHLFEKFYRIETPGQERLPGTGLGLYLVRRCMELEDGSAQASSAGPGRGACFTVRWPAPRNRET